jgi:hypothetical protein
MSQLFNELFNVNLNIVAAGPSRPCRAGGEELERWLRVAARHAGRLRKRVFLSHLYIKMITLPRQARDKHRESSQKADRMQCYETFLFTLAHLMLGRGHWHPWGSPAVIIIGRRVLILLAIATVVHYSIKWSTWVE